MKTRFDLVHLKASREYPTVSFQRAAPSTVEWHVRTCRTITHHGTIRFQLNICAHAGILIR